MKPTQKLWQKLHVSRILKGSALVISATMIPTIVLASSWSPTLLVNTEAFQTIDDGDGSSNIELRFGTTGSGLILNVTDNQFEFDTSLEVHGTVSGNILHAQDLLTSSGELVVEGAATFGSTLTLNTVTYTFPSADGTDGFVLTTNNAGVLTWTNKTAGSLTEGSGDERYVNISGDTMTGALVINNEDTTAEADLEVSGTASGYDIIATDSLRSSGTLVVSGTTVLRNEVTFGSGIIINGVTYVFPFNDGTATGKVLKTDGDGQLSWSDDIDTNTNQLTTFLVDGDSGAAETIAQGNTLFILGGDEITTDVAATDTININITDDTVGFTEFENAMTIDQDTTITFDTLDFVFNLDSSGDFEIQDNGNPLFFADDSGKIGILTATPETELEVVGTISGTTIHAEGLLTSSGTTVLEGEVTFGSGIIINGVTYVFPFNDGSASGKVLKTDGDGQLSWSDDIDTQNADQNIFETFAVSGESNVVADSTTDTLTFVAGTNITITTDGGSDTITITGADGAFSGTGSLQDFLDNRYVRTTGDTMTGALLIDVGFGNETNTADTEFEVVGTISGSIIHAQDTLTSSGTFVVEGAATFASTTTCTLLTTDSNGLLTCDAEGFDESVDDRVASLLQAGTGITLTYDDSSNTFTIEAGFGSGNMVNLSPEWSGAVYYGDGANNVGQLVLAYDATNFENFYKWDSTVSSLQDYNISVRIRIPDNFDHWDATAPIEFRYRSNAASTDDNQIDVTMLDTANGAVSLTGGANLANTSWTTATITGPEASGTYTQGGYVTLIFAMQARTTNTGEAHAGFINLNWHTNHP